MEPKVIFEDEEILVLDKPAGMTVNRADTTRGERTVQDWIEDYLKWEVGSGNVEKEVRSEKIKSHLPHQESSFASPTSNFFQRSGIVHRLDKETSGVLIVAKTPEAFESLQKQFKERSIKKTYIALVHGLLKPDTGEINVPVGRLPWNRKRFGVIAEGRESITRYKVVANYTLSPLPFTLLELYPATGRTHQIRVHLKYLGFPIVSDNLYGGRKQARSDRKLLPRLFLHAKSISFTHPKSSKQLTFESTLAADLQFFLDKCKTLP